VAINWFTFFAQILNFFVLIFVLQRFLYKPITQAMARREKTIRDRLSSAAQQQQAAVRAQGLSTGAVDPSGTLGRVLSNDRSWPKAEWRVSARRGRKLPFVWFVPERGLATFPGIHLLLTLQLNLLARSHIVRAERDDQLGRPAMDLGLPFQVLREPASARLDHCLRRLRFMPRRRQPAWRPRRQAHGGTGPRRHLDGAQQLRSRWAEHH